MRAAGECGGEAGGRTGLHEHSTDGVADEVVDEAGLAEADLSLGGMDVDVDFLRRHLEEEEDDGIGRWRDDVAIGLRECVQDELVADETLVDEDVHRVAVELLELRLGDEAGDAEETWFGWRVVEVALPWRRLGKTSAGEVYLCCRREHVVGGFLAEDLEEAVGGVGNRWCGEESLCGAVELEVFGGMSERVVGDESGDMGELGLLGLEELAARWSVVEEIADCDGGSRGKTCVFDAEDVSSSDLNYGSGVVFGGAGFEG